MTIEKTDAAEVEAKPKNFRLLWPNDQRISSETD